MASAAAAVAGASTAAAHPSPAEPPAFFNQPCIRVVDRADEPSFQLTYGVPVEDTVLDPDLVDLPDTKTHQFFAVAGRVFARAGDHAVVPFDSPDGAAQVLPLWLNDAELGRVRQAAADHPVALAVLDDAGDTLEHMPALAPLIRPFTSAPARVPITTLQGARGVSWDLTDVPLGPYQIAGYTFSPPYNAWTVRPGIIQLVDSGQAGEAPPAIWLDNVAARIFQGQGRRITGCIHGPEGSSLQVETRAAGDLDAPFEVRLQDLPIDADGRFEGCLLNPGENGSLSVRVTLRTPGDDTLHAFSVETLELFAAQATCREDETLCCDPNAQPNGLSAAMADAGLDPGDGGPFDAAVGQRAGPQASKPDAGPPAAGPPAQEAGDAMVAFSDAGHGAGTTHSCHCRIAGAPGSASPGRVWPWLAVPLLLGSRRKPRWR